VQAQLANDRDAYIRETLATNPVLTPALQAMLAADPHPKVRAALARNPELAPEARRLLVSNPNSPDYLARLRAAQEPGLPPAVRAQLAGDDSRAGREAAEV
jgi:hypothetical protein